MCSDSAIRKWGHIIPFSVYYVRVVYDSVYRLYIYTHFGNKRKNTKKLCYFSYGLCLVLNLYDVSHI